MKGLKKILLCTFIFGAFFVSIHANAALSLKVGVVTPKGTTWANTLDSLAKEVETVTKGEVKFKMYYGAVQGDEPYVLRKIRSNQMQGGVFTGRTLGEINGDVRIVEVPFTFGGDRASAFKVLEKLTPKFNEGFSKNKFKNLGFIEIGLVYMISTKKVDSFEHLKGVKIWAWEGDKLSATLIDSMKLVSVPLALPDVLSSLSTGIVEAVYSPPLAILAMQWQTKTKFLIDFPITYAIGAFLVSQSAWDKIPKAYQKVVEDICHKYIKLANELTIKENVEALETIKKSGLQTVKFPIADIEAGKGIRLEVIKKLQNNLFSKQIVDLLNKETNNKK